VDTPSSRSWSVLSRTRDAVDDEEVQFAPACLKLEAELLSEGLEDPAGSLGARPDRVRRRLEFGELKVEIVPSLEGCLIDDGRSVNSAYERGRSGCWPRPRTAPDLQFAVTRFIRIRASGSGGVGRGQGGPAGLAVDRCLSQVRPESPIVARVHERVYRSVAGFRVDGQLKALGEQGSQHGGDLPALAPSGSLAEMSNRSPPTKRISMLDALAHAGPPSTRAAGVPYAATMRYRTRPLVPAGMASAPDLFAFTDAT